MKALLIVAHGSRRPESNREIEKLAEQIAADPKCPFSSVRHAFLELSTPTVASCIKELSATSAETVTVLPCFLAAGTHVTNDLPALINEEMEKYPQIHFSITPHLGGFKGIAEMIIQEISPHS